MRIFKVTGLLLLLSSFLTLGINPVLLAEAVGVPGSKTIEERLGELEKEIALLRRLKEVDQEVQAKKEKETPILTVSKEGFNVKSKDSAFILKFRGQAQTDARFYANDDTSTVSNTFLLRRVRPTLEGTVFKYFDFRLMPDFGGGSSSFSIQDAWVNYKYWRAAQLRVGKFKAPLGLERLQADAAGQFIETALSTNLIPNRDIGVDLNGELFDGAVTYDAGVFNGSADNGNGTTTSDADIHDDKEFVGRVFAQPFKNTAYDILNGLGVGLGASAGTAHGSNLPTYRSGGQQTIFSYTPAAGTVIADGRRIRIAPQAYYYSGPFGFLGEYVLSQQELSKGTLKSDKIENYGWQLASTYVLTGENASYTGVVPNSDFNPGKKTWGAFELAGRFSSISIDKSVFPFYANPLSAVTDAKAWDIGINWYLNRNLKFMTHFEQTFFEGGKTPGGDRKTENALLSRLQIYF